MPKQMSRRNFIKLTGGVVAAASSLSLMPHLWGKNTLQLADVRTASAQDPPPDLHLGGTDGWIYLPETPAIPPYFPDNMAPPPFNTYIFGFANLTGLADNEITTQKMQAQHAAPLFWTQQGVPFRLKLTNLGLQIRPDLIDAHTVHWHGFRNVIPFFDGEPGTSVSVPPGRDFTYIYNVHEPGTYMYHCHVEDVEHVQMGMTGLVFVRPAQDGDTTFYPTGKYAYNDGDGSTGFDREFAMFMSEVWAEAHWADSHLQLPEWSDYKADFSLLNGRVWPDTLAPNGYVDPFNPNRDANLNLIAPAGRPELQYQPYSSLVNCNEGDRVLLRFANLGFRRQSMTLTGIKMRVVGKDATLLRGRYGEDLSYETDSIAIGAGESYDVIFTAPAHQGADPYNTYLLFNRSYSRGVNGAGHGGQMTEIRVHPAGTLPPQTLPNT